MDSNTWLKIILQCEPILVEPIADYLVGILDAGVETGAPDEKNFGVITCYVEESVRQEEGEESVADTILAQVQEIASIFQVAVPSMLVEPIQEEDWTKSWKVHFQPFAIIPGLVIAPSWEQYEPGPEEQAIIMDPGMAFGTGHHATTSLSLEMLQSLLMELQDVSLLDIGTGTGILGMAGVCFGAAEVVGIDNDPEAVLAAEGNIVRNSMQDRMRVSGETLTQLQGDYPVVVANIVHDVLVELACEVARLTAPNGWLILSGILSGKQVQSIIGKYTKLGFSCIKELQRQEWSALQMVKTS